ncbi:alpha/beta fold hydrolase [Paenibacillus tyrfis]|uniref:Ndr family protein n=1 Tax=Paenibacillus tyrfis TaxID=1501230 RepID=A0A081P825_9BACL|nr:alpha/beta hydrolase [Paenibacillus tyrfis]KEQ26848.1 Ndr family protein [Paenibacillus tyrfis]
MKVNVAFKSAEGKDEVHGMYDSLLKQWASPHETWYVPTRYGDTFVIASGEKTAPPLLLLHGTGMNSAMWLGEAREYSRSFRVYAVDIPGDPGRSDERQLPLKGSAYADWLYDVFQALDIRQASLIGISLGAWLAVKFSVSFPDKVDKLALLCPSGIGPQKVSFLFTAAFHMLLGERGKDKLYVKVNGNRAIPEAMLKYQKLIGKSFNYRREQIPLFADDELKRLTMPVVLFVGAKDIMLHSAKTAKRLGSLLPHAQINILPDAGHTLTHLAAQIIPFLKSDKL